MIYVCSLATVASAAARVNPTHVISIVDPDRPLETPPAIHPSNHVRFFFHDIEEAIPGHVAPNEAAIERLLAFGDAWDAAAPILVHCHAGVSRSPAAAFILMCQRNDGREQEAATVLRKQARHAWPNRLMVEIADALLARNGRLVTALRSMPPAPEFYPTELVQLPARL